MAETFLVLAINSVEKCVFFWPAEILMGLDVALENEKVADLLVQLYSANIVQSTDINAIYELNHNYKFQINKMSYEIQYILFNTTRVNQTTIPNHTKITGTGIYHPGRSNKD